MGRVGAGMAEDRGRAQDVIVGISGASGAIYGLACLDLLRAAGARTHLIVSRAAELTLKDELGLSLADIAPRADVLHAAKNIGASVASGSFKARGMIVAPCSVKTLAEIATGTTGTLLSRAADVTLKERRRLVLMVRETPLHLGHLRAMVQATEMGAIIAPPVPAFYARPQSLEDMVNYSVARALDLLGFDIEIPRWQGLGSAR